MGKLRDPGLINGVSHDVFEGSSKLIEFRVSVSRSEVVVVSSITFIVVYLQVKRTYIVDVLLDPLLVEDHVKGLDTGWLGPQVLLLIDVLSLEIHKHVLPHLLSMKLDLLVSETGTLEEVHVHLLGLLHY